MHIQIMFFDGPRSADLVEATDHAGRDRIRPLIDADPQLRAGLVGGIAGVGPDGAQCVVVLAHHPEVLDSLARLVMTSELLPDEDPALLQGPSRIERYASADVFGHLADILAGVER